MTIFQFALNCGNDDLLQLLFEKFESNVEFMEDCVLATVETDVKIDDLIGILMLINI